MALRERRMALGADPDAQAGAGGDTVVLKAGAALSIGDCVYVSGAQEVDKSTTQTNAKFFVGVVVGGGSDFGADLGIFDTGSVGLEVAPSGKSVVVQVNGIANVVAGDTITAGQQLMFDTGVAGSVIPGTTAGQIVGIALTDAADTETLQMLIAHY